MGCFLTENPTFLDVNISFSSIATPDPPIIVETGLSMSAQIGQKDTFDG